MFMIEMIYLGHLMNVNPFDQPNVEEYKSETRKILEDGKEAVDKYLNFLKSGSSDYPINILKEAGVDMSSPEPILAVTKKMDALLDEMESLIIKRELTNETKSILKTE